MRSRMPLLVFLLLVGSFALPYVVHAGVPFFGPIISPGTSANGNMQVCPLGWGAVISVINNIISLLLTLAIVFVAPLMVAYAGFLFVVNPVNAGGISEAKSVLRNTIVGIVIALAGYLIVAALMAVLYNASAPNGTSGGVIGAWSSIVSSGGLDPCMRVASSLNQATTGQTFTSTGSLVPSGSTGGGSCSAITDANNACSVASMSNTCFSSRATEASKVCNLETGGGRNPAIKSGSDLLAGGRGPSYSIGLWQINLTTTAGLSTNGQACTSAFTLRCEGRNLVGASNLGACYSEIKSGDCGSVSCQKLYDDCVVAAQNPTTNTNLACGLYGNGGFAHWRTSANRCGVPF